MSSAKIAARQPAAAGVARLRLTHLWPGTDKAATLAEAAGEYSGDLDVADAGLEIDIA